MSCCGEGGEGGQDEFAGKMGAKSIIEGSQNADEIPLHDQTPCVSKQIYLPGATPPHSNTATVLYLIDVMLKYVNTRLKYAFNVMIVAPNFHNVMV